MKQLFFWIFLLGLIAGASALEGAQDPTLTAPDEYTRVGPVSFLTGYPARRPDGLVNVVVEIPAGTTAKWEVDKSDGTLRWELERGEPRTVKYLAYPANYGMIPRTLLPAELGGDGDPLDVVLLGPAIPRGSVVPARILGVLRLLDGGEQDDKLLAVARGTDLAAAADLDELRAKFAGVTTILETWFSSYKGPGEMESQGFAGRAEALELLAAGERAFEEGHAATAPR